MDLLIWLIVVWKGYYQRGTIGLLGASQHSKVMRPQRSSVQKVLKESSQNGEWYAVDLAGSRLAGMEPRRFLGPHMSIDLTCTRVLHTNSAAVICNENNNQRLLTSREHIRKRSSLNKDTLETRQHFQGLRLDARWTEESYLEITRSIHTVMLMTSRHER